MEKPPKLMEERMHGVAEFALRRTAFFLLLIFAYLFIGATVLTVFRPPRQDKVSLDKMSRLDVKRSELLNVLWAETLVKSENDWEELANQKLEVYEKALLASSADLVEQNDRSFWANFERAFSLVTTIGPIDCRELSTGAKVFCFFYACLGVPLALLYLGQCNRMVAAMFGQKQVFLPTIGILFLCAVVYDIIEQGTDDTPFLDAMFSAFLQFSTIGEEDPRVRGIFTFIFCMLGLSLLSVSFINIQQEVEKRLARTELMFTQIFGDVGIWASHKVTRNTHRIDEEDEEDDN